MNVNGVVSVYCSRFDYCRIWFRGRGKKGKSGFVKNDVARCDHTARLKIQAAIPTVILGISEEHARGGARAELVRYG